MTLIHRPAWIFKSNTTLRAMEGFYFALHEFFIAQPSNIFAHNEFEESILSFLLSSFRFVHLLNHLNQLKLPALGTRQRVAAV